MCLFFQRSSPRLGWNGRGGRQSRLSSSSSATDEDGIFVNSASSKLLERAHDILMWVATSVLSLYADVCTSVLLPTGTWLLFCAFVCFLVIGSLSKILLQNSWPGPQKVLWHWSWCSSPAPNQIQNAIKVLVISCRALNAQTPAYITDPPSDQGLLDVPPSRLKAEGEELLMSWLLNFWDVISADTFKKQRIHLFRLALCNPLFCY